METFTDNLEELIKEWTQPTVDVSKLTKLQIKAVKRLVEVMEESNVS